jgi:hypothetical protein
MNIGGIGPIELLFTGAICVVGLVIPVAVLAFLYVIYNKLTRIEQLLDRKD